MTAPRGIELWGGAECTLNRVRGRFTDQLVLSGHARRIDDLDRFASLGITALRYPVLWERVAPESIDRPDWSWPDERLRRIRELGLRPIVGLLHHGSGPRYTSLLDPEFPDLLERYAAATARRYPWVDDYTPVNEPLTTARFSCLYGHWYPHATDDRSFVRALLNQVAGTVKAMRAIRLVNPHARLIQTEDTGRCFGTRQTRRQAAFENHRRWLTWDLLCGRVDRSHPLYAYLIANGAAHETLDELRRAPSPPNVIGVNYYVTSDRFLDEDHFRYPEKNRGGNGRIAYADVEAVRVRRRGITGHCDPLLAAWRRYQRPVALTEVHLACTREEQSRWLADAWNGANRARASGAEVVAITPWALLGSFDWNSLVTETRGHYESGAFDVRSSPPRPTMVAQVIRTLAADGRPSHSALAGAGWWRRDVQPRRRAANDRSATPESKSVLILGANGTLGRALGRVAASRGLDTVTAARHDADVTDLAAVTHAIRSADPWAVINASGYVRVDDAERDPESCRRVNVDGAVNVATACRQLDLPLVTYSSDLVFDGDRQHSYTERDEPRPVNVYGASKAEAERAILRVLPAALIVRSSAFFGPWDEHNFVSQVIDALESGREFHAAHDVVVSPTYVPDLAHATFDLLLDEEQGLWHLANQGQMSWFDLARAAATAFQLSPAAVKPVRASELGWVAPRPSFSALGSCRGAIMRPALDALSDLAAYRGRHAAALTAANPSDQESHCA